MSDLQADVGTFKPGQHPDLAPPRSEVGIVGWLRANLFSSWTNSLLTVAAILLLLWIVPALLDWLIFSAVWTGENKDACLAGGDGACWAFIGARFNQFMYGFYPEAQRWRVDLAGLLLVIPGAMILIDRMPYRNRIGMYLVFAYPLIAYFLLAGFSDGAVADWPYWLMGVSALALATAALLPYYPKLRGWTTAVSIALLVLLPIWGLSAPPTWTVGTFYGAPDWSVYPAILLAVGPALATVACLFVEKLRAAVLDRFWPICIGVGVLALIGFWLPILTWDPIRGPAPPLVMAIAPAAFAVAALAPWGYDRGAGMAVRIAYLLMPVYLFVAYLVFSGPPDALNFGFLDWTANTTPFFRGVQGVMPFVETPRWGGLMLTLVIAITGIAASLPLGIVLALGRRSNMPTVRLICVVFIEFWRGVPLITVLFMASVMFPLFLPEGVTFNQLLRALIGVALFSSAYMAEVVRGGLQALGRGQYEGADALGLSYWQSMRLIIMPQALKIVIPGIVNTFIGLFKDTTLVLIIGLIDFLNAVQTGNTDANWLAPNVPFTGYVFAAAVYWVFCFGMSRYSQSMERKLDTGYKQ